MALGAVALGYGHPAVTRAAVEAVEHGVVGPLPPVLEEELAARALPADALGRAGAVSQDRRRGDGRGGPARAGGHRPRAVLGCGYHGWLDWCQGAERRVCRRATRALYAELPFNDAERDAAS